MGQRLTMTSGSTCTTTASPTTLVDTAERYTDLNYTTTKRKTNIMERYETGTCTMTEADWD